MGSLVLDMLLFFLLFLYSQGTLQMIVRVLGADIVQIIEYIVMFLYAPF